MSKLYVIRLFAIPCAVLMPFVLVLTFSVILNKLFGGLLILVILSFIMFVCGDYFAMKHLKIELERGK